MEEMCSQIAFVYSADILNAIQHGREVEDTERARFAMDVLCENAEIAKEEHIPICQDTGMVTVWLEIGQDVHLVDGDLNTAIQQGVSDAYTKEYLRASVVDDPLFERKNTKTNTPAIIYTTIVPGETVTVEVMAKGFGSENKSRLKMLTPAEGVEGVKQFVAETVALAGPNACPPFLIGVGIGGTFDYAAYLSKRALMRPLDQPNQDERYANLESELLTIINNLNVGPMGFHGKTTALKVQVEYEPTHIAGLPVAVNMCCHVCRHAKKVIEE